MSEADGVERVLATIADAPSPEVTADLTVTVDGMELTVTSFTDLLRIEVATARDALRLARIAGVRRRLAPALSAAGLTAEVRVGKTRVAVFGADADPGPVGRRLGEVELRPVGALLAALRTP